MMMIESCKEGWRLKVECDYKIDLFVCLLLANWSLSTFVIQYTGKLANH